MRLNKAFPISGGFAALALVAGLTSAGCDALVSSLKLPTAGLQRVDLVNAPTVDQSLAWACHTWFGSSTCSLLGWSSMPSDAAMQFSFDIVFDLYNPNESVPIPLVELLLGIMVFEEQNLGAICVSFCDEEDTACVPSINAEGACEAEAADDVKSVNDIVPTVEDLLSLAESVAAGDTLNGNIRLLEPLTNMEGHIQFDLSPDTMMGLGENMLNDAVNDVVDGRNVEINVPYAVEGSVFFDIPEQGKRAIGFGPFDDEWALEP